MTVGARGPGHLDAVAESAVRREIGDEPDADDPEGGDDERRALRLAGRALRSSPKTRAQLLELLEQRGVTAACAAGTVQRLEKTGDVDDAVFARLWVDSRQRSRGLGRDRLRQELADRGVSDDHIEAALSVLDEASDREGIRELAERLGRRLQGVERRAAERRLAGMLLRRGHAPDVTWAAVADWADRRSSQCVPDSDE